MSYGELLNWLSILFLSALAYRYNDAYLPILFFWTMLIIIIGNARRIQTKKLSTYVFCVRRSMYVVPLFIVLLFNYDVNEVYDVSNISLLTWLILGLTLGIITFLPKLNTWKIFLSEDFILLTSKKKAIDYLTMVYVLVGGAIGEEVFFRMFIIGSTLESSIKISIAISTFLFFLYHFGSKWSYKFEYYDYLVQILFGILSGLLYFLSNSILPSILAHLVYNSPHVILNLKSYYVFYIKKGEC